MKRLGPELKMPKLGKLKASGLKVPLFLSDLYWDLWERRLLPLVALAIAAIIAVPFLLGGGSREAPSAPLTTALTEAPSAVDSSARLTVVQAEPGLRDYHKRLSHRTPTDPFKPHEATSHAGGGNAGSGSQSTTSASFTTTTTTSPSANSTSASSKSSGSSATAKTPEPSPSPPSGGGDTGSSGGGSSKGGGGGSANGGGGTGKAIAAFAADVKITKVEAGDTKQEPVVKRNVLPLTRLPGDKAPVVTYIGASHKGRPLLLVSTEVKSVFGEAKCLEGSDVCQLLEVEPGFPVTFTYGANEARYRINVLRIDVVTVHS